MNLEIKISEWRQQMLAAGISSPEPLEELESHLREAMEQSVRAGFSDPVAFDIAVRKIGQPGELKTEFTKVHKTDMNTKLKPLGIIAAFGAILMGVLLQAFTDSFISIHHNGQHGAILFHWPVLLVVGLHLTGLVCLAWPSRRLQA